MISWANDCDSCGGLTNVPRPWCWTSRPSSVSVRMARRTVPRATLRVAASSGSLGSRVCGGQRPDTMNFRNDDEIWSCNGSGTARSSWRVTSSTVAGAMRSI